MLQEANRLHDGAVNRQFGASEQFGGVHFLLVAYERRQHARGGGELLLLGQTISQATFVRPTSFVPSVRAPNGWRDPGLSMHCATYAANLEHANALIGLRLPNALQYFAAISDILRIYMRGEGEFQDLD